MAITTTTKKVNAYTYEMSVGSAQEILDRLDTLHDTLTDNSSFQVLGYGFDGENYHILMRYLA